MYSSVRVLEDNYLVRTFRLGLEFIILSMKMQQVQVVPSLQRGQYKFRKKFDDIKTQPQTRPDVTRIALVAYSNYRSERFAVT